MLEGMYKEGLANSAAVDLLGSVDIDVDGPSNVR